MKSEKRFFHSNLVTEFAALMTIYKSLVKNLQYNPALLDEAKKVAFLIEEDSFARIEVLEHLASALAKAGRYHEAKEVLSLLKNSPVVKAKELQDLAVALARAGTAYIEEAINVFSSAEEFTYKIKHMPTRVNMLKELAAIRNQIYLYSKASV